MTLPIALVEQLTEWHIRADALTEAGHFLDAKGARKLRAARDSLSGLIDQLDDPDAKGPASSTVKKAIAKTQQALGEATDLSHSDIRQQLDGALNLGRSGDDRRWVRDVFDAEVIYEDRLNAQVGVDTFSRKYTITDGDVTLGDTATPVVQRTEWTPVKAGEAAAGVPNDGRVLVVESAVQLSERAVRDDGSALLKVIDEGWGSSGYYSQDVLASSGPAAFPKGTHMYWDHPTEEEAEQRPERSLRDLAAVLTEDAAWREKGPDGPGLYAPIEVRAEFRPAVDQLASDIGASVRSYAFGVEGEAEGQNGRIIQEFIPDPHNSVDFVTLPGRGGSITQIYESYRHRTTEAPMPAKTTDSIEAQLATAIAERATAITERDDANTRADRAEGAVGVFAARDIATEAVRDSDLPDAAKLRIVESAQAVTKDGALDRDATKAAVEKAATDEADYLARVTGKGQVTGMGGGTSITDEAGSDEQLQGYFERLGLTKEAAAVAAAGRSH